VLAHRQSSTTELDGRALSTTGARRPAIPWGRRCCRRVLRVRACRLVRMRSQAFPSAAHTSLSLSLGRRSRRAGFRLRRDHAAGRPGRCRSPGRREPVQADGRWARQSDDEAAALQCGRRARNRGCCCRSACFRVLSDARARACLSRPAAAQRMRRPARFSTRTGAG
jgi:hypothetical protein